MKKAQQVGPNESRKVPDGVSVFDLIMPWKNEVDLNTKNEVVEDGLSEVHHIKSKGGIQKVDLASYANDVQAILINPPWDCTQPVTNCDNIKFDTQQSKKPFQCLTKINIKDFTQNFDIPTSVMKDGLVFIWVEKEIIFELIKFFEEQDFTYVENVCYVMLDQNQKKSKSNNKHPTIYFHVS